MASGIESCQNPSRRFLAGEGRHEKQCVEITGSAILVPHSADKASRRFGLRLIVAVKARSRPTSTGLRGVSTGVICATVLPRRVMLTLYSEATRSTNSLKRALASAA